MHDFREREREGEKERVTMFKMYLKKNILISYLPTI